MTQILDEFSSHLVTYTISIL